MLYIQWFELHPLPSLTASNSFLTASRSSWGAGPCSLSRSLFLVTFAQTILGVVLAAEGLVLPPGKARETVTSLGGERHWGKREALGELGVPRIWSRFEQMR